MLLGELQKLREAMADDWKSVKLVRALRCKPRDGSFENEIALLVGSNTEFLKQPRSMATWFDIERLYLLSDGAARGLQRIIGDVPQPVLIFAELLGDAIDCGDVMDLVDVQVPAVATRDSSVSESSPLAAPAGGGNRRKPGGRVDSRAKDSGLTMYKVAAPHCHHDAP